MSEEIEIEKIDNIKKFLNKKIESHDVKHNIYDMMLEFMESIATHDHKRAEEVINQLLVVTEGDIYNEVGKITRRLHDSINNIKDVMKHDFSKITDKDVPEALDMLKSVNSKTEDAVNRTMVVVEKYFNETETFSAHMKNIKGPDESINYITSFRESLNNDMTEILTIQQFQDITGQTIKKVIGLVHDVETELVKLVSSFGVNVETLKEEESVTKEKITQTGVDDLLKGLGF